MQLRDTDLQAAFFAFLIWLLIVVLVKSCTP